MSEQTHSCRIARLPGECVLEFASFAWPSADLGEPDWPCAPGAVRRDGAQRALLLHFGPGRWLVPDPGSEIRALLDTAAAAGRGTIVEVTGKYEQLSILGSGATRLLASGIDVEAVLRSRECAALALFDCPAVIVRVPDGYALWVQSSYATDFVTTAERFRMMLEDSP
jgi:sarcosine oxidase gamma subunit